MHFTFTIHVVEGFRIRLIARRNHTRASVMIFRGSTGRSTPFLSRYCSPLKSASIILGLGGFVLQRGPCPAGHPGIGAEAQTAAGIGAAESGPTPLATDSKSARDVSYNPEHHDRMKHVQRRHFFVRDMVEEFELEIPFVRTNDNIAAFFTKPLNARKFYAMRRIIMNER